MKKLTCKSVLFFLLLSSGIGSVRAAEECCEPASQEEQHRSLVLFACYQIEQNGTSRDKAIATELRRALDGIVNIDAIRFVNDELNRVLIERWPSDRVEGILVVLKHELLGLNPDGSEKVAQHAENAGSEASEVAADEFDTMLNGVNNAFKVYLLNKLDAVAATGKPQDVRITAALKAEVKRICDLQVDDFFNELDASFGKWPSDEAEAILRELKHQFLNIKI